MSIYKSSRYYYAPINYISLKEDGASNPVVSYDFPSGGLYTFLFHTVVEGERLDQIANQYYERSGMWWKIIEVNQHVSDPLNIKPGTVLRIPV